MKRARIILADDHSLLLDALRNLLASEFDIVGTFQDGQALVEGAVELSPDVIVLDIGMPKMNGLIAAQYLKRLMPDVKLIFVTMNLDQDLAKEAFQVGAAGYLLKNSAGSELGHAIREALVGRSYITPLMAKGMEGQLLDGKKSKKTGRKLTLRQKEVLQLLVEGHSMKEVAFMLDVSPRTIAFHKYAMMEHLQLKSSAELIQFALKNSIASL